MKTLGVTGRGRNAAAALAINGRLVAAAMGDARTGDSLDSAGGLLTSPAAMACLASADVAAEAIDHVNVVGDFPGADAFGFHKASAFDPVLADAVHACAPDTRTVLVASERPASLVRFRVRDEVLANPHPFPGGTELIGAAGSIAASLGAGPDSAFAALDRLAANGEFLDRSSVEIARWEPRTGSIHVNPSRIADLLAEASDGRPDWLADGESLNVKVQKGRRAAAASFLQQVTNVISEILETEDREAESGPVALGGSVFSSVQINSHLRGVRSRASAVARVPEFPGRALGAAVAASDGHASARVAFGRPSSLALGPSFGDVEIKRTLDNCRLDYVYEPDWHRLYARVSAMLAQGKIVAWFQGAAAFGPRSLGTRSILADPSSPYARHNMNEYLRQLPLDEPLPLVLAPSTAARFGVDSSSQTPVIDLPVIAEMRHKIQAALDSRHRARIQPLTVDDAPRLAELLELHHRRTSTPGLLETNLAESGLRLVTSPRDAVRVVYSSAIDALILGRFILMKDHWLLRSHVD